MATSLTGNAMLWYDTPTLRHLVILDVKWVVDAATSFIRQYDLEDHTENYERMAALDERAKREEKEAWDLLTKGSAILQRKVQHSPHPQHPQCTTSTTHHLHHPLPSGRPQLLRILWSSEDFKDHQDALLDLMIRFNLAIPLRSGDFLVPALLPTQGVASLPDAPAASSAQMRIFFFLDGQAGGSSSLMCSQSSHELSDGFLPANVFHRLCAAAISCSHEETNAFQPILTYKQARQHPSPSTQHVSTHCSHHHPSQARIAMHESTVTLSFMESSSSILVHIDSKDVRDGSAAAVYDRLRVLLAQETSLFKNLKYRMLALVEGTDALVDLDELPKTKLATVTLRGEQVGIETLKDELALWQARQHPTPSTPHVSTHCSHCSHPTLLGHNLGQTTSCTFNFIDAAKLRAANSEQELPKMIPLQEMLKTKPGWIIKKKITLEGVLR